MDKLKRSEFYSELHKRVIVFHILGMPRWKAKRVALHYFDDSQYELATRMAEQLMDYPDGVSKFFKRFPISTVNYMQITDALLRHSVPDYRSFGLKPKMVREIPTSSIIK